MHMTDAAPAAPGALPLQAWSADVFTKRERPPPHPVLAPVLARGAITFIAGPRGVGKSWLALAMAHATASGRAVLGWEVPAACRVVYLDLCGGEVMLRARLDAIAGKRPAPRLALVPGDAQAAGLPDIATEAGLAALDAAAVDADLVVLDGLSALIAQGRGVGARWAALAAWLRSLRRRGKAVLLVDAAEPRAIAALADTVLRLERPLDWTEEEGARFRLRVAASRALTGKSSRRFEARLAVRRGRAAWTRLDDLDQRAILAWRLSEGGFSSREIAQKLEVSPVSAWRLIQRGEAMDPALRDNAEIREAVKEERRREAAALREADRKAREFERGVAAWAQVLGPVTKSLLPNGEKEGSAAKPREDEGKKKDESEKMIDAAPSALRAPPHPARPLTCASPVGEREQTANPPEAMKQPPPQPPAPPPLTRAQLLWRTPLRELLAGRPEG